MKLSELIKKYDVKAVYIRSITDWLFTRAFTPDFMSVHDMETNLIEWVYNSKTKVLKGWVL